MSGAQQVTFMNQRSFGLIIGQAFGGGFFAGQISTTANGVATHNLVVGPLSTADTLDQWSTEFVQISTDKINGPQNTANIVAKGGAAVYPCAHFCNNLTIGGFSDFYMPAINELDVCYFNLKPRNDTNNIGASAAGINPNAVPARASQQTLTVPAQTSAAAFQQGNAEAFALSQYWASSVFSSSAADNFYMGTGILGSVNKSTTYRVRAIRRVAV